MRILQVTDGYPPAVGGLERTVKALAHELADRGHQVEVATLGADAAEVTSEGAVTVRRLIGWTRHLRRFSNDPHHQFHPTAPDPQLVRRLQEVVDEFRPDVVHAHGWILHSCLSLRLPTGTALVVTLHDYSLNCAKKTMVQGEQLDTCCAGASLRRCLPCANQFYGPVKGTALTLGLAESRRRLDRVDMFLPVSGAVAGASLPGVEGDRIVVIPPFVPDGLGSAPDLGRPDFLPAGDFLLFVGALGAHKGIDILARAHQNLGAALPLVVIGPTDAEVPVPRGSADRPVILRSGVAHEQIMAAFSAATVAVVPSRWSEPFGLVAVEALACGVPVVASRVGALGEIVLDGDCGLLVEPGDVQGLTQALDRLISDPGLRRRLGRRGKEHALTFAAAAVVPRVIDVYQHVLQRVSGSPRSVRTGQDRPPGDQRSATPAFRARWTSETA